MSVCKCCFFFASAMKYLQLHFNKPFKMQELDFPEKETRDMDMVLRYVNVAHTSQWKTDGLTPHFRRLLHSL